MLDLSRAQNIRNYKSSFGKTADKIIDEITNLKESFENKTTSLNDIRKERNEIIDKATKVLAKNGIKLNQPLGRYENFDLCMILCNAASRISGQDKETLEICSIQIDNRYHEILDRSIELESMMNKLSNMSVLEEDSHEEVVLDLNAIRKKKEKESKTTEPIQVVNNEQDDVDVLEEVVNIKKASPELIDKVNNRFGINNTSNYVDYVEESLKEESMPFTIDDNLTLIDIAGSVYGDSALWKNLYKYGNNKSKIDRRAKDFKVTVTIAATNPGYLRGLELDFPFELVEYEEVEETNGRSFGKAQ